MCRMKDKKVGEEEGRKGEQREEEEVEEDEQSGRGRRR